jgi:hypothetical protein
VSDRYRNVLVAAGLFAFSTAAPSEPPVRDPTVPPGFSAVASDPAAGPGLRLHSTRVSATSRSAVINDRFVTPGSTIAGATVLAIEPGRVQLQRGTERILLRIKTPDVKQRATGDDS